MFLPSEDEHDVVALLNPPTSFQVLLHQLSHTLLTIFPRSAIAIVSLRIHRIQQIHRIFMIANQIIHLVE